MSNKILMVGALACLSAVAVAQADQSKDKAPTQDQVTAPRDAQSGQASGKRMHKPMTVTAEVGAQAAETSKPTGKSAMDDWQAPAAKTSQPKITENNKSAVATGDASGGIQSPRDLATGQSSGKRQHEPVVTPAKETAAKPAQK
jgi:hypothetical protein